MGKRSDVPQPGFDTARVFKPLLAPARYKGAWGGRGSAKSHFFAELAIERCLIRRRSRGVCVREVQKSLKESAKRLLEDKIDALPSDYGFKIKNDEIVTPGGGVILFQGLQDHSATSIKSLENFDWAWIEEGQTLSERSFEMLRPTIRAEGSEIWASWNPRSASDPIDAFFRSPTPHPSLICVQSSWRDNPWFPDELEAERQHDEATNRDRYAHIWLGAYEPQAIGAIWTRQMISDWRRSLDELPALGRTVVGIDPAVSNEAHSDEHGIVVAALGEDRRGYVLEDGSLKGTPRQWADRAVSLFDKWDADAIVIERNQGGDMCREVLRTVRPGLPVIEVVATRGKHVRAEPIAALYAAGRVSHVGTFGKLEDQLCLITAAGYDGEGSPDRADACLVAGTRVLTESGHKPIESVRAGEMVLTRKGYKPVEWSGKTRESAEIYRVELSNGDFIEGTAEHPVWCDGLGFVPIESIMPWYVLSHETPWQTKTKSNLTGTFTGAIQTANRKAISVISAAFETGNYFIASLGKSLTGLSQRGTISTTSMATGTTTIFPILSACLQSSTGENTPESIRNRIARCCETSQDPSQTSGTAAQRGLSGIPRKLSNSGKQQSANLLQIALRVANRCCHSAKRILLRAGFGIAPENVTAGLPIKPNDTQGLQTVRCAGRSSFRTNIRSSQKRVHVVAVRKLEKPAPVYNLHVKDCHEFFANGVLVHNCVWALTELFPAITKRVEKRKPAAQMPASSWMG